MQSRAPALELLSSVVDFSDSWQATRFDQGKKALRSAVHCMKAWEYNQQFEEGHASRAWGCWLGIGMRNAVLSNLCVG